MGYRATGEHTRYTGCLSFRVNRYQTLLYLQGTSGLDEGKIRGVAHRHHYLVGLHRLLDSTIKGGGKTTLVVKDSGAPDQLHSPDLAVGFEHPVRSPRIHKLDSLFNGQLNLPGKRRHLLPAFQTGHNRFLSPQAQGTDSHINGGIPPADYQNLLPGDFFNPEVDIGQKFQTEPG